MLCFLFRFICSGCGFFYGVARLRLSSLEPFSIYVAVLPFDFVVHFYFFFSSLFHNNQLFRASSFNNTIAFAFIEMQSKTKSGQIVADFPCPENQLIGGCC